MKVKCLPKDIPQEFIVDITNLDLGSSIRLKDINIPKEIRPLAQMEEVAIVVGKR